METRANYVLIGIFTLAVIVGAFLFVLWLSGASRTPEQKTYRIVFTGSVSGLSRGSSVLFNGLNVGAVRSIDFLENDPSRVVAVVAVAGRTPIKTDTKARLEQQGLTGVAAIALTGGAENAAPLKPGPDGAPPTINAEPSQLQSLLENVQRLSTAADQFVSKANQLLDENSGAIHDTLVNVDTFSKALAENSSGVNAALKGVADLGRTIAPLTNKLQSLSDDVDGLVKAVDPDKVRSVVNNIDAFAATLGRDQGSVDSLLKDTASLAKKLNQTAGQLDGALADFRGLAEAIDTKKIASVVDNVSSIVSAIEADKIHTAIANIATFSTTLADNKAHVDSLLADAATLASKLNGTADQLSGALGDVRNLARALDDKKIADVVSNVDRLVAAVDPEKVSNVVSNAEAVTRTLANNQGHIDNLLTDASSLAGKLNGTADQLAGAIGDFRNFAKAIDDKKIADVVNNVDRAVAAIDPQKVADVVNNVTRVVAAIDPQKVGDVVSNADAVSRTLANNQGHIGSLLTDASSLAGKLNGTADQLAGAIGDFRNFARSLDDKKIASVIDNVASFAEALGENRGNVDRTLKNASELSAKLDNSADRLDQLMVSAQNFLGSPETKGALAQIGDAARSVRQFADDLDVRAKEISVGLTRFSGSGLREYEALAIDARRTLNDLDQAIRSFERNPNQVIFGSKPALPEYHGGQ